MLAPIVSAELRRLARRGRDIPRRIHLRRRIHRVSCRKGGRLVQLLLAVILCACNPPVRVGDPAPAFVLTRLGGGDVRLQDLSGKIVFLHFWATWCPPCITELPQLEGFMKKADPGRATLLAVCVDDTGAVEVRGFLDKWGFSLPVCLDPGGRLAKRFGTFRYPETYILDEQGVMRRKISGPADWTSPEWVQFLQSISEPRARGPAR